MTTAPANSLLTADANEGASHRFSALPRRRPVAGWTGRGEETTSVPPGGLRARPPLGSREKPAAFSSGPQCVRHERLLRAARRRANPRESDSVTVGYAERWKSRCTSERKAGLMASREAVQELWRSDRPLRATDQPSANDAAAPLAAPLRRLPESLFRAFRTLSFMVARFAFFVRSGEAFERIGVALPASSASLAAEIEPRNEWRETSGLEKVYP